MILLISLLIGTGVGLILWNVCRVLSLTPAQDRTYLDQPPAGFNAVWPLIQLLVYHFGHYVSQNYLHRVARRLILGGVEYRVSPEQFLAGKCLASLGFALFAQLCCWMLETSSFLLLGLAVIAGYLYPELWLKDSISKRTAALVRSFPFYLDVITLAVESGSNLTGGITHAVKKSPESPLKSEFSRALRDIRAGKARADALREMADRTGNIAVSNIIGSMIQAEQTGSSIGPLLRAQSEQLRNNRFLQAEKLAMEAPVKLLGPLVMFIFPTTFMVLGFVILVKALERQLLTWPPLVWAYNWPG